MVNKNITFLLVFACFTPAIHCMLSEWKYEPYIAPDNVNVQTMRRNLARYKPTPQKIEPYPNIEIKRLPTEDEKTRRCGYYALKKITGSTYFRSFDPGNPDYTSVDIEHFFDQIKAPQPGALVVYTNSAIDLTIKHFAVVVDHLKVESKWGSFAEIMEHFLFESPYSHGNAAFFFILKKEYLTEMGNIYLQLKIMAANAAINEKILNKFISEQLQI